ncbi:chemotaxis-specific protein-glutamate methyltransferase CheB [Anaeromyxobacter paludicola]|uniref:Protein-glutamate methylesterase/protein-glutamine glutaminase n=1 Tax=Anaeromyxobacter paludicola TaxID=2918171 RepID=A0ABN6N190_9BACT|nr:chemotaxis-specific protein-glutamate methyltransferase CheB [Anaeromyxobacter paludicola]BDG06938.1 chemotaxis response regulator protein-glutamate methylesterase of group 3 operon [Anaeromyxobacter paludicola]
MVVDDSTSMRRTISDMLSYERGVQVVGRESYGEEALKEAFEIKPDAICLDLQMPRLDGFTFLRLLMSRQPTPVIVISSNSRKSDVFKALELGALDFIAKPEGPDADLTAIRDDLLEKIGTVRALQIGNLDQSARSAAPTARADHLDQSARPPPASEPARERPAARRAPAPRAPEPMRLLVIGASTGGPPALQRLLTALPGDLPLAVVVGQHMPERFTAAFAERLGRTSSFSVSEAADRDVVAPGRVLVAPGGKHLQLLRDPSGEIRCAVLDAARVPGRRYCPSVDLILESAARVLGERVAGVILTGMGNDGRKGIEAVKAAGGLTIAESEETAVVYGMPKEAVASGCVDEILPLGAIAGRLVRFTGREGA